MNNSVKSIALVLVISLAFSFIAGCENEAKTNALIGSGIGLGIAALAGGDSDAMLIGGAAGGGIGYLIGNESDKKKAAAAAREQEMRDLRAQQNTETVWVTNTNGSKSNVKLQRSGPNYIGPNGEVYSSLPTQDQLRPVYGF